MVLRFQTPLLYEKTQEGEHVGLCVGRVGGTGNVSLVHYVRSPTSVCNRTKQTTIFGKILKHTTKNAL